MSPQYLAVHSKLQKDSFPKANNNISSRSKLDDFLCQTVLPTMLVVPELAANIYILWEIYIGMTMTLSKSNIALVVAVVESSNIDMFILCYLIIHNVYGCVFTLIYRYVSSTSLNI